MKKIFNLLVSGLALAILLAGCSQQEMRFEEKSYTADITSVTGLDVQVQNRKILLEPSPDGQIHLVYFDSEKETYAISATEDHTLSVTLKENKDWSDYVGTSPSLEYRILRIQLPQTGLNKLSLSTTGEDISLPSLQVAGSVALSVNNGSISFDRLDVGTSLHVEGKNGNITGVVSGGYDDFAISCSIKKGETTLPENKEGGSKSLTVSMNNGNVDVSFDKTEK